jgi:hypothetical protein
MLTDKGLCRIDSGVEAMCRYTEPKNVKLFGDLKVTDTACLPVIAVSMYCDVVYAVVVQCGMCCCLRVKVPEAHLGCSCRAQQSRSNILSSQQRTVNLVESTTFLTSPNRYQLPPVIFFCALLFCGR